MGSVIATTSMTMSGNAHLMDRNKGLKSTLGHETTCTYIGAVQIIQFNFNLEHGEVQACT